MIGIIIWNSILSIFLIVIMHQLYVYGIDTLTVPKTRDLVYKPTKRYNDIMSLPKPNSKVEPLQEDSMQTELRDFLNQIKKGT
uniref:Uncharacterized protein n=1 Tax=viral metagenome TaxID=1070528 RepID=A0A6C0JZK3_9ZZZZ